MTYEEIKEKYPIGKLLARELVYVDKVGYWATQADKELYLAKYKKISFDDNGYVSFTELQIREYHVQGWICTNEGFFVAELTWDGWQPLDEDDLAEIEAKGITYEF